MHSNNNIHLFSKLPLFYLGVGMFFLTLFIAPIIAGKMFKTGVYGLQCAGFLSLILSILSLCSKKQDNKKKVPVHVIHLSLACLVVWVLFLTIRVKSQGAVDQFLDVTCWLAVCLATYIIARSFTWGSFLAASAIAAGGSVSALLAIQEFILAKDPSWRAFGPFFNPGYLSGYLTLTLPLTSAIYFIAKRWLYAVLALLCSLLQISALFLSGTRYGIATGTVAFLLFAILAIGKKNIYIYSIKAKTGVFLFLAAVAIYLSFSPLSARVEHPGSEAHSGKFRAYTWAATLRMALDNPFLGSGPGSFEIVFPKYNIAGFTRNAHQSYLQAAAELGFPGAALVIASIGIGLLSSIRSLRNSSDDVFLLNAAFFAGVLGSAARGLVDSDLQVLAIAVTFWTALGTLAVADEKSFGFPKKEVISITALIMFSWCIHSFVGAWLLSAGEYYYANGDFDSALKVFKRATFWACKNDIVPLRLGQIETVLGNPVEGIKYVNKAIELEPRRARNYNVRGILYLKLNDYDKAIESFKQALDRDPKSPAIRLALARAYQAKGNETFALAEYKKLLEIEKTPYGTVRAIPQMVEPEYAFAHYAVAEEMLSQGKMTEAQNHLISAAKRLERRALHGKFILAAKLAGTLSEEDDEAINDLYKSTCKKLAEIALQEGDIQESRKWAKKAKRGLKTPSLAPYSPD